MQKSIILLSIAAILLQSCGLNPVEWVPPKAPPFQGSLSFNDDLQNVEHVDLTGWYGPEDFAVDDNGNVFCGVHAKPDEFDPGAILKISKEGEVTKYMETSSWVTGMHFNRENKLIALIHGIGLAKIEAPDQVEVLVSEINEDHKAIAGTGLDIASDGKVYFASLSSEKTITPRFIQKLILEQRQTGGVYCYDPKTGQTEIISEGNYFGNGVALSKTEEFLLVSETSKYRIMKYWLKGEKAGKKEVFLENLPGFPNNINLRENGSFWVGFTTKRNDKLDQIHPKKAMKKFVYALPGFLKPKAEPFGMIIEYSPEGEVVRTLFDPSGEKVSEAGAVFEHDNKLYIGGDVASYISVLELK